MHKLDGNEVVGQKVQRPNCDGVKGDMGWGGGDMMEEGKVKGRKVDKLIVAGLMVLGQVVER
jgi:hypothetical protein